MIEKMLEFNVSQAEFLKMFELDNERAIRVCNMIYEVSIVKDSLILKDRKEAFERLLKKFDIYYKAYEINDIEKIKDKMFLNKLKNTIHNHEKSSIEIFYDKVDLFYDKKL